MKSPRNDRRCPYRLHLSLVVMFAILTGESNAQPGTLANAIDQVEQGNFSYVDQVVRLAGPERAIPTLEDLFSRIQDLQTRDWIASTLVKIGDKNDTYWHFVTEQARESIESGAPDFQIYDSEGAASGKPAPEFVAWAKAHNLTEESAEYESVFPIGILGATGDRRAIPLLRRALLVPNHMAESVAASALAMLKDKDSMPLIVEACKRAPSNAKSAIALSLLAFRDPEAQSAAEPFLPEGFVKKLHEEKP